MRKKLTALILILGSCFTAFAETFVVTSNADSGPGTLREAIEKAAANGTTETDFIHFNIADLSEAGRTITVQSGMPSLTSNLVIDGTTQPGSKIGLSNAKIVLYQNRYIDYGFAFLTIPNASGIKLFGLCFRVINEHYIFSEYAIKVVKSSDITIGAANKGNMFLGVNQSFSNISGTDDSDSVRNVTFQNNYFGFGHGPFRLEGRNNINLTKAHNIKIGGSLPEEGNYFFGTFIRIIQSPFRNPEYFLRVENNKFNFDGTSFHNNFVNMQLYGNELDDTATVRTVFKDNIIGAEGARDGIDMNGMRHKILIQGNQMGDEKRGCYYNFVSFGFGRCNQVIIGGLSPAEQNSLGSIYTHSSKVHIMQNKIAGFIQNNWQLPEEEPFVKILKYDNGIIKGKANANAKIQLYTTGCAVYERTCDSKVYFKTLYADANGDWEYHYDEGMPNIIATATTVNNATSDFSIPKLQTNQSKVTNSSCSKSNGSITGVKILEGTHIKWLHEGKLVGTDTNLLNVPAGYYTLKVYNGENSCTAEGAFIINDISLPDVLHHRNVVDATCGQNNGYIGIMNYSLSSKWMNAQMDSVGSGYDIGGLMPGKYYLKLWVPFDTTCNKLYGPFEIKNKSGPTLNLDKVEITNSSCDGSNGSIKNITALNVTGTSFIQWVDSLSKVVGTTFDLENVPAGKYRLKFKDQSSCDTIITPYYTIENKGALTLNTDALRVTPSNCPSPTGTITGIQSTGAEGFTWYNNAGNVVARALNPGLLFPGDYTLTAYNSYGCNKQLEIITVGIQPHNNQNLSFQLERKIPRCDSANGYLKVVNFPNESQYTFRWVDSARQNVNLSTTTELKDFPAGLYFLYAKDQRGCEQRYVYAKFEPTQMPELNDNNRQIGHDVCDNAKGFVTGIQVKGGIAPYQYTWLNDANAVVGSTQELVGVRKGQYTLLVQDRMGCQISSALYPVLNERRNLAKPIYREQTILKNTAATLTVTNFQSGTYQLFESPAATVPLQQNEKGIFETGPLSVDKTYYIKVKAGTCESAMETVQIKVVDETKVFVPNAFSPNGDGKNELLHPKVIGLFHLEHFLIYDRWGNLVFQSTDLNKGWNGQNKNRDVPDGVYVWMLKGKDIKGNAVFQKGTTMLLR